MMLTSWFQDETRIGQQGSIARIWHYRGKDPRVVRQQQFISTYLMGVCPATGQSVGLIMPYANGGVYEAAFTREISQTNPKVAMQLW